MYGSVVHVCVFATLWTAACQAPLSMESFRQEYGSGMPFPPPGDLPKPGIKPRPPVLAGGFFTTEPLGKPTQTHRNCQTGREGIPL